MRMRLLGDHKRRPSVLGSVYPLTSQCLLYLRAFSLRKGTLVRRNLPAIDIDALPADPVGLVGAEEDDGAGDVGSGAGAAHGDVGF